MLLKLLRLAGSGIAAANDTAKRQITANRVENFIQEIKYKILDPVATLQDD